MLVPVMKRIFAPQAFGDLIVVTRFLARLHREVSEGRKTQAWYWRRCRAVQRRWREEESTRRYVEDLTALRNRAEATCPRVME